MVVVVVAVQMAVAMAGAGAVVGWESVAEGEGVDLGGRRSFEKKEGGGPGGCGNRRGRGAWEKGEQGGGKESGSGAGA